MSGLTAEQTADGVGRLLWWSQELTAALAAWDEPSDEHDLRVWVAGARRRLDSHVDEWRTQLPESVLLEPDTRVRPSDDDRDRLDAVVAARDPAALRQAAAAAITAMVAVLDELVADAGPVADGALRRTASVVRADLVALTPTD